MNNLKKISTILSNGTKVEYTVILTFKNNTNNKNYAIYTDNTYDQNKKLRFYAAVYDPNNQNPYLGEPTNKEEWSEITSIIDKVIPTKWYIAKIYYFFYLNSWNNPKYMINYIYLRKSTIKYFNKIGD